MYSNNRDIYNKGGFMDKVQISIWATPAEVQMFECLKKHLLRRTNSDLIRHLINQEYQKFYLKIFQMR